MNSSSAGQHRSSSARFTAALVMLVGLLTGCGKTDFPQQRPPVLETVVSGDRVVPQDPDGRFAALPIRAGRIHLRVQADWGSNITVSVDNNDLPRREGRSDDTAWFDLTTRVLSAASRNLFWNVEISLPPDKRGGTMGPVNVEVRDNTILKDPPPLDKRPPLTVQLINISNLVSKLPRIALPSDYYNEAQGDNLKGDGRSKDQVVAKGVVLAGWLFEGNPDGSDASPHRNDDADTAEKIRPNESEDYHYDFWLDNDFIARNYGSPVLLQPVRDALVKGARSRLWDFRLYSEFPLLIQGQINAASFLWPGNGGLFTVELNAWHLADRGRVPAGWAGTEPTEPDKNGNAWPFRPRRPLGVQTSDPDLAPGDYVIISGTLWQDESHANKTDDVGRFRQCWDDNLPRHGNWLEIHPVDSIRRVDAPSPRKHTDMVNVCSPIKPTVTTILTPRLGRGETTTPDLVLRCQRIIDRRFTGNSNQLFEHLTTDMPPKLSVYLGTLIGTQAQVTYVTWYEKPDQARPAPNPRDPCVDWTAPN